MDPKLPGFADYVIQYYTAVVALVFGLVRHIFPVVLPNHSGNAGNDEEHTGVAWYQIFCICVCIFAVFVLARGAVNLNTLQIYTKHTTRFGVGGLPPMESWLTWLRITIAISGIWHSQLKVRKAIPT